MTTHTKAVIVGLLLGTATAVVIGSLMYQADAQAPVTTGTLAEPAPRAKAQSKPQAQKAGEPAAATAQPGPQQAEKVAAAPLQPTQALEQLQKAGVKRCLGVVGGVSQASLAGASEYATASTWHQASPDSRLAVSMIGQKYAPVGNGISTIVSAPTVDGKCDVAALQVIPVNEPCSVVQAKVLEGGKALGNLAGVPILQNAASAQVLLLPAAANTCVVVSMSAVFDK